MATVLDLNFDGSSNGTAADTTNTATGGTGAFDAIETGSTFTSTYPQHGALGLLSPASASGYARKDFSSKTVSYRVGFRFTTNPVATGDLYLYRLGVGTTMYVSVRVVTGTGKLRVQDFGGTTYTATNALAQNTDYWLEINVDSGTTTSNGKITCAYYPKDSSSPVQTLVNSTSLNAGNGVTFTRAYMLKYGAVTATVAHDDLKLTTDFTTIGPASISYTANPADTAGGTDSASSTLGLVASAADSASVTDTGAPQEIAAELVVDDPAGATDAASRTADAARGPADSGGGTDSAAASLDLARALADAIGATDAATALLTWERAAADSIGATDAAAVVAAVARTLADSAGATDTAARTIDGTRGPADGGGATDAATAALGFARTSDDAAGITDALEAVIAAARTAADTAGASDAVTAAITALIDVAGATIAKSAQHRISGGLAQARIATTRRYRRIA